MYCQQQYAYQPDYPHNQHSPSNAYSMQHMQTYAVPNYGSVSPYNSVGDRPSPSFRIDDILVQNKNGHGPAAYTVPYSSGFPSPGNGMNHAFSYRLAHAIPHQHQSAVAIPASMHTCTSPTEKDYQGPSPSVLSTLPVYFRLKPTLRTASGRKCRKPRTVFSELQLMVLNREFTEHKYLSTPQRTKLAERLGLNQTQVKTWFQNRRMKWKKETTEKERKADNLDNEIMHSDSEHSNAEEDSC